MPTRWKNLGNAELVQACLSDEPFAWDAFVERFQGLVYSVAKTRGLRPDQREDAMQVVFLLALRHLKQLKNHDAVTSWLIKTTQRECTRLIKAANRKLPDDLRVAAEPSPEISAQLEQIEAIQVMQQSLDQLGGTCQQLLTALFKSDPRPSYDQIAEQVGIARGSIGPTRARCLEKLARIFQQAGQGPPPSPSQPSQSG